MPQNTAARWLKTIKRYFHVPKYYEVKCSRRGNCNEINKTAYYSEKVDKIKKQINWHAISHICNGNLISIFID